MAEEKVLSDNIIKILEDIGVDPDSYQEIDNYLVFNLYDYDYFNDVYNRLEKNIEVDRDSDNSSLDAEKAHIIYVYKNYLLELIAFFDEDEDENYTLNIFEGED